MASTVAAGSVERSKRLTAGGWKRRDWTAAGLLLLPFAILFAIAVVYPLIETIRLSFFDVKGLAPPRFFGFGNYLKLFADPQFRNTLLVTLVFSISTTVISVAIGWALAMVCAFAPRETTIFRVMIFAAFGVAETVSGIMWLDIYRPGPTGLLNSIIGIFSPGFGQAWLGDPNTVLWALVAAASWGGVGLPLMLCFASVQGIQQTVLEAAVIDGASPRAIMRYIMMPLSLPGVRVAVFINLLGSLRTFDLIFVLTGGGPVRSTETVGYFVYTQAMTLFKLGYGAAATIVLLIAVLVISIPAIVQRTRGAM
jgi:ABC-type sugar transport system permease subunit